MTTYRVGDGGQDRFRRCGRSLLVIGAPDRDPWGRDLSGELHALTFDSTVLRDNRLGDPASRPLLVYTPPGWPDSGPHPAVWSIQGLLGQADQWRERRPFGSTVYEAPAPRSVANLDQIRPVGQVVWVFGVVDDDVPPARPDTICSAARSAAASVSWRECSKTSDGPSVTPSPGAWGGQGDPPRASARSVAAVQQRIDDPG